MSQGHFCRGGTYADRIGWWFYDGCGIELFKGCDLCAPEKLKRYRPEVLRPYDQNDVDEPIDGEPDVGPPEPYGGELW